MGKHSGGNIIPQVPETGIFSVTSHWASCHGDGAIMRIHTRFELGRPSVREGKEEKEKSNLFYSLMSSILKADSSLHVRAHTHTHTRTPSPSISELESSKIDPSHFTE